MGYSPDAYVAWGVVLAEGEDWENLDFTEEMEERVSDLIRVEEWQEVVQATEVLIDVDHSGSAVDGETEPVVHLKRQSHASWDGPEELDPIALPPPIDEERRQIGNFMNWLGYNGDRVVRLLHWVNYG